VEETAPPAAVSVRSQASAPQKEEVLQAAEWVEAPEAMVQQEAVTGLQPAQAPAPQLWPW
jgi:hypothetical protein